jgi:peroxiredoxin Q/BCP
MINEGDRAPALSVTSSDGSTVDLSSPGQPLVLYFYPKDDTSGCTLEAQNSRSSRPSSKRRG